jgi:hypothetical protein
MNKKPVDLESVPELIVLFSDIGEEAKEIATQTAKLAWLNKSRYEARGDAVGACAHVSVLASTSHRMLIRTCILPSPPCASRSDFLYWQQCAELIKIELEKTLGPTWHVIVGDHFGAFIAHEVGKCFYFSIGQMVSNRGQARRQTAGGRGAWTTCGFPRCPSSDVLVSHAFWCRKRSYSNTAESFLLASVILFCSHARVRCRILHCSRSYSYNDSHCSISMRPRRSAELHALRQQPRIHQLQLARMPIGSLD